MKIIALFLVAMVLILAGQYANLRMKKRIVSLRQLIVMIENIDSHISFSRKTIGEIISNLICGEKVKLKVMSELLKCDNGNFSDNWKNSVENFSSEDCLNIDDKNILLSFGKSLGITDTKGQTSNCMLHKAMLEKQLNEAEEKLKEKEKVNTAVSFFLALSAVIIFC